MMKVLILGLGGQLAYELEKTIPASTQTTFLSRADLDITKKEDVWEKVLSADAKVLINAAAYTAVDRAENNREQAYAVNAAGVENLAHACKESGKRLIHISTDFVFDGMQSTPYGTSVRPNPQSVYGASKFAGEQALTNILPTSSVIFRTSWLYSSHGANFVKTMLKLMNSKEALRIIADQTGTPTWARGLARAIWSAVLLQDFSGIYHWSDAGVASWYDFSVAIQELALEIGLLDRSISVLPIATKDYPTAAQRPQYSVLDKERIYEELQVPCDHWRGQLRRMLLELKEKEL